MFSIEVFIVGVLTIHQEPVTSHDPDADNGH